jgi:hypothetical protein
MAAAKKAPKGKHRVRSRRYHRWLDPETRRRQYWEEIFIRMLDKHPVKKAADTADEALAAHASRFPNDP